MANPKLNNNLSILCKREKSQKLIGWSESSLCIPLIPSKLFHFLPFIWKDNTQLNFIGADPFRSVSVWDEMKGREIHLVKVAGRLSWVEKKQFFL